MLGLTRLGCAAEARQGVARRGEAWRGLAWHGTARSDKACYVNLRDVERELGAQEDKTGNKEIERLEAATRRFAMRVRRFVSETEIEELPEKELA